MRPPWLWALPCCGQASGLPPSCFHLSDFCTLRRLVFSSLLPLSHTPCLQLLLAEPLLVMCTIGSQLSCSPPSQSLVHDPWPFPHTSQIIVYASRTLCSVCYTSSHSVPSVPHCSHVSYKGTLINKDQVTWHATTITKSGNHAEVTNLHINKSQNWTHLFEHNTIFWILAKYIL